MIFFPYFCQCKQKTNAMNKIDLAIQIATTAHSGQTDRDGEAYILHPLTVGLMGNTDEERCAGFLHDVLEDTDTSPEELIEKGIPASVVNAVKLLTHDKTEDYFSYIQRVIDSGNPIALHVKHNDLRHNFLRGKAYPDLQAKHGKALKIVEKAVEEMDKVTLYQPSAGKEYAIFAAGCFWGVQHYFQRQKGVTRTYVGYTGGVEEQPNYEQVRKHQTSHVEAILVEYNPDEVSYEELAMLFFEIHDPSQTNGQGPDIGSQYLSAAFHVNDSQLDTINHLIAILRGKGEVVNTFVKPAGKFWIAELYHQNYYDNTGGSPYCHFRIKKF